jgi:hypothetical protein
LYVPNPRAGYGDVYFGPVVYHPGHGVVRARDLVHPSRGRKPLDVLPVVPFHLREEYRPLIVRSAMDAKGETEAQVKDLNGEASAAPPKPFDWNNPDAIVLEDDGEIA